ncbi:MAG: sensor histidine kinase [Pyrinomonadaceae bacterium]
MAIYYAALLLALRQIKKMMPDSVRARLTLWYTGVLALVLVLFAFASYFFLASLTTSRTDASLLESADAFAATFILEQKDGGTPDDAARVAVREFRFRDRRFIVLDANAQIVAASSNELSARDRHVGRGERDPVASPQFRRSLIEASTQGDKSFQTLPTDRALRAEGEGVRAFAKTVQVAGHVYTVVVTLSLHDQQEMLETVRRVFYIAVPIALLLASLGGYFLARKSLAPVVVMSDTAERISAANLHLRLPVTNKHDELGKLAVVFNRLLARLHSSFEQQRRFMADASHELRTPIAIVRGEAEVALSQNQRPSEDLRESLAIVMDEGRHLTRIVEDLFTLARADAGQHRLMLTDFYLDELVGEAARSMRTLIAERGLSLRLTAPVEMPFRGDEALLSRLVLNLLDNAIKHTPVGGLISLTCERKESDYLLTVADTGCGILSEAQPHIFERFYRADKARSRAAADRANVMSGAGLGLSIACWIVEAHNGTLELQRSDASGSVFIARFAV